MEEKQSNCDKLSIRQVLLLVYGTYIYQTVRHIRKEIDFRKISNHCYVGRDRYCSRTVNENIF